MTEDRLRQSTLAEARALTAAAAARGEISAVYKRDMDADLRFVTRAGFLTG